MNGSPGRPARLAILADDLTGALDCAAAFIATGSAPYVAVNGILSDVPPESRVASTNADTRRRGVEDAASAVMEFLPKLTTVGAELRYVKIDSTLRG